MSKKVIRAGIAGSGFAARFHYDALLRVNCAEIRIEGAFSPTRLNLDTFTGQRKIRSFNSLDEMVDNVDVVHVCTPPSSHEEIVLAALKKGKNVVVEKPFTGYFGDGSVDFNGDTFSRETGLKNTIGSITRMLEAEKHSGGRIMYAENWVYAPAVRKEKELIEKTKAQILWMHAEESHSGSHSLSYGQWKLSGGGSMIGKGCHPLSAALYLKQVEGMTRTGRPIRPARVTARTHAVTRMKGYNDEKHLRTTYQDTEDFAMMHVIFDDGTFADVFASELVLGGVHNWIEVNTSNHRTICNISPNNAMQTYTPDKEHFRDIYLVEKTETKEGWSSVSPDETWFTGYQHEMEAFYRSVVSDEPVESNSTLAADTMATIYSGYLSAERKGAEVEITLI